MVALRRPSNGRITSYFGWRDIGFHHGIDFGFTRPDDTQDWNIYAAADGFIEFAGWAGGLGNTLSVQHAPGFLTDYAHCSRFIRASGTVKAGELIAIKGATGDTKGAHLHFQVRVNGVRVNPLPYFTDTAGGDPTPITLEEDHMTDIKYLHTADAGDGKPAYALTGVQLPGGYRLTRSRQTAEVWGAMHGKEGDSDFGAPWKSLTTEQWPILLREARAVHESWMELQRSLAAPIDADALTQAVRDGLAALTIPAPPYTLEGTITPA